MDVLYDWIYSSYVKNNKNYDWLLEECSNLYSTLYGKWSKSSPYNPGQNIRLSPAKIQDWLNSDEACIYWEKDKDILVGYAIDIQLNIFHTLTKTRRHL